MNQKQFCPVNWWAKDLIYFDGVGAFLEKETVRMWDSETFGEVYSQFEKAAKKRSKHSLPGIIYLDVQQVVFNLPYKYGLAGPRGANFTIVSWPETTKDRLDDAKNFLKTTKDAVSFDIIRIGKIIEFEYKP